PCVPAAIDAAALVKNDFIDCRPPVLAVILDEREPQKDEDDAWPSSWGGGGGGGVGDGGVVRAAGLLWSLKAQILSDHVEEYLETYESVIGGGLGLSSEQPSESLHSRVQRLWNLRFKVDTENSRFADRLVDCMVTYNWNLDWDGASRATPDDDTMLTA
ncbi:hypothetical protein FOZ62_032082, partial [Perkinsus olseni]